MMTLDFSCLPFEIKPTFKAHFETLLSDSYNKGSEATQLTMQPEHEPQKNYILYFEQSAKDTYALMSIIGFGYKSHGIRKVRSAAICLGGKHFDFFYSNIGQSVTEFCNEWQTVMLNDLNTTKTNVERDAVDMPVHQAVYLATVEALKDTTQLAGRLEQASGAGKWHG